MKNYGKARLCLSAIIITMLFGMVGCNSSKSEIQHDNKSNLSDVQEQEITDKIERLALPNQVQMSMSMIYDIDTLKADGIVKTIRFNKNRYYSITPLVGDKYLFLLFSKSSEPRYVVDGFLVSRLTDKDDFKNISVGMDREEILKKDSSSYISGSNTYHRFSDKSVLCIEYDINDDSRYIVSAYDYISNSDSVLNYLLKQDLDKIS